jgi:predicted nucleic acid-binding protein
LRAYADSSFIVALYLQQQSSPKAIGFMEAYGKSLPFTAWHRLEVRNAIRLAVFHAAIDASQAKSQLKQLDSDLKDEVLLSHLVIDWTDVLREAEKLGAAHNDVIGCRSADLFHVAAAKKSGCDTLLTFDEKQKAMANAAGLLVKP